MSTRRKLASTLVVLVLAACGEVRLDPLELRPAAAGSGNLGVPLCTVCDDFRDSPVVVEVGVTPIPADIGDRFGSPGSGTASGGPCLAEPEPGSLFPKNWLRPRFKWSAPAAGSIVELRLKVDVERDELVVYTDADSWLMDAAIWSALGEHAPDHPISMAVRSLDITTDGAQPALGSYGSFTIAPVEAPGSLIYFAVAPDRSTSLNELQLRDESVKTLLAAEPGRCVGCHALSPDGSLLAYSNIDNTESSALGSLGLRSLQNGAPPDFLTPAASALLERQDLQLPSFSAAHYQRGDRIALALLDSELTWLDLEASSAEEGVGWGRLERTGDVGDAALGFTWSHDGAFVVYPSGSQSFGTHIMDAGDLYRVPYAAGRGGVAEPILGASEAEHNEFDPVLSPDDALLAFDRAPAVPGSSSYDNAAAELFVLPAAGGTPLRLAANDPCPCLGTLSPGVTNSLPAWAPNAPSLNGKTYYFLAFSSGRAEGGAKRLFVAPVVTNGAAGLISFPALYLWNQPQDTNNHAPTWRAAPAP